jgi:hypothetical protein
MFSKIYRCTQCGADNGLKFYASVLLICNQCGHTVFDDGKYVKAQAPPDDWSFVQIGTKGTDINKNFEVIGRVRLQLRNEYKNYWTILYTDNTIGFLYESFGSFAILDGLRIPYKGDIHKLKAGLRFTKDNIQLIGEFVEKCEDISFAGEIARWDAFNSGFFIVQAASAAGHIAVFQIIDKDNVYFYFGKKLSADHLKLQNIIQWNDWK